MANGNNLFEGINIIDEPTTNVNLFEGINIIDDEEESFDLFKDINLIEEPTNLLNNITQQQIEEDDNFIRNEEEKLKQDPGLTRRFVSNFIEGLSPVPVDVTSDYQDPDTLGEKVAGVAGQVVGFGAGLFATGGVLGGLKIVGTGAKATKALATASKGYTEVARLRKIAKTANTAKGKAIFTGRALKQEAKIDAALDAAGVIKNNSLLGRSENYRKFITKVGSGEYSMGKFLSRVKGAKASADEMSIRAANTIDLGINNLVASGIMFQKTIPLRNEEGEINISERITKPIGDAFFMTLGGLPRVLGAGKIGSLSLNSKSGKAVEAGIVFSTGVGASLSGVGSTGKKGNETTTMDNLIDGAIFTAAHYIGVGADNLRVKQLVKDGISTALSDKSTSKKLMNALNVDEIKLLLATKRPEYLRNRFIGKAGGGKSNQLVQLQTIKEAKGGGQRLSYTILKDKDDLSGKTISITGDTKQEVLNQFYKDFKSVIPDTKKISRSYFKKNPFNLKTGNELKTLSPESYKEHQSLVSSISKLEADLGIGKKESFSLKRSGFTRSYGKTDRMTIEELTTYKQMLKPKLKIKNIQRAKLDEVLPFNISDDFFKNKNTFNAIRKYAFSPEANFRQFGVAGQELSKKVTDYAITKNLVRGMFSKFANDTKASFKLGKKEFDNITGALGDEKIALLADPNKIKNIKDVGDLKNQARNFFDELVVEYARNGGQIKVGTKKFKNFLSIYDKQGNIIKVSEDSFDNGDVLKILQRKGSKVKNTDGKIVNVDYDLTFKNSAYVEDYVPYLLSEKAKKILKTNESSFTTKLRTALKRANPDASKDEIDEVVGAYITFSDPNKPLGILDTRKVDIPPYMLLEKGTGKVIQLDELPNVNTFKKGQSIVDADNQSRVIGDVVELYEKDFSKILDFYGNKMANAISLARNFDVDGASGKVARRFIGAIERESKLKGIDGASDYTDTTLKLLLSGEAETSFTGFGRGLTTTISSAYLSGPSAAIKNFLTGQVQNLTSVGTIKLLKSYSNYVRNKNVYKDLARNIGATSDSIDELFLTKGKLNPAFLFRNVERLNRRTSVAVADVTMRDSFETLLSSKQSSLIKNTREARRILKDAINLDGEDIDYMLSELKKRKKFGDKAFDLAMNDKRFEEIYQRGLFKSQAATQGVTQLPYIPTWMAKNNVKPLTLFYRTAYRVTENTYNNAVKPFIVDGNPFPLFRFAAGSTLTGAALYNLYYENALGKDLIGKDFKKVPMQLFDYAVRGEALGLLSNVFDGYGGVIDSYVPVPVEFVSEFINYGMSLSEIKDLDVAVKGTIDYATKQVTLFKQVSDFYKEKNNDINKQFDDQRRLQFKFLDNYQQFKNKEQRSGLEAVLKKGEFTDKQFYFKFLSQSLIAGDDKYFEKDFLKTRAFLEHKLAKTKASRNENFYKRTIRNEVHSNIKSSLKQRLRPYPEKWDDIVMGKKFSDQYKESLSTDNRKKVENLMKIYEDRMRLLDNVMRNNYLKFDSF